jgi:hypothetical protein
MVKFNWILERKIDLFNPVEELKNLALYIEGKIPTEIEEYIEEKVEHYRNNGIVEYMYVGKDGDWKKEEIAEWLLSQFVGTFENAKKDKLTYNTLVTWLKYVYHYIIEEKK